MPVLRRSVELARLIGRRVIGDLLDGKYDERYDA
jgi:hypothetical protein